MGCLGHLSWAYMDSVSVVCGQCGLHIWAFPYEVLLDMGLILMTSGISIYGHKGDSVRVVPMTSQHKIPFMPILGDACLNQPHRYGLHMGIPI